MGLLKWVTFIQSVLTSVAIVVGGWWAYRTFNLTQSPEAIVNTELLKEHCEAQGVLDISIVDDSKLYPQEKGIIVGHVAIKNVGTKPVTIHFPETQKKIPLRISKINIPYDQARPEVAIVDPIDIELLRTPTEIDSRTMFAQLVSSLSVLPGRTVNEPFIVKVNSGNWYMVDFSGGPRDIKNDDEYCRKYDDKDKAVWEATAILHVD